MPNKKVICLTGGGTAGHVTPHFALLPHLRRQEWEVFYIGSNGMEKGLVAPTNIQFFTILTGKLRRYFSWQNFLDVLKVAAGVVQSLFILGWKRPSVVFSKGGFVSVPVCLAAWIWRIPVVTHESDLSPGLATKIISKFASRILFSFPESKNFLPASKSEYVGSPVREELLEGDKVRGQEYCKFSDTKKKTLLFMGGSLGAERINQALASIAEGLVDEFNVIHITGKGKDIGFSDPGYRAFPYVGKELKDIFALTDYVVARAGANSIFEFLKLNKPMLLVPLSVGSRGDQIQNAESFAKQGFATVLPDDQCSGDNLRRSINELVKVSLSMVHKQKQFTESGSDAVAKVLSAINQAAKN